MYVLMRNDTLINLGNVTSILRQTNGNLNIRHIGGYCENIVNTTDEEWDTILRGVRGELGSMDLEPGTADLKRYREEDMELSELRSYCEEHGLDYDGRWAVKKMRQHVAEHKQKMSNA